MEKIHYSKSLELKVTVVDNQLTVGLNLDIPGGTKIAEVYNRFVSGFASGVNDTIDLTATMADLGGSAIFTAVASNFSSGGAAAFQLIADGQLVYGQNQSLKAYTSQQWAVSIEKK